MRVTGRRLLLGVSITAVMIVVGWAAWTSLRDAPSAPRPDAVAEVPIPEPQWGDMERVAPVHVGRLREQLDWLKSAPEATPGDLARAYGELGEVYLAYDIPLSAVACFQNASGLDVDSYRWPYLQAVAHLALLDTRAAARAMSEAVNRQRRDSTTTLEHRVAALCFLGEAAIRLNDLDEARSCFNEALSLTPNSVFVLFKRGQLASQAGDGGSAIADFEFALSRAPGRQPKPVLLALGMAYEQAGRKEEAARLRSQAASSTDETVIRYPDPLQAAVRALNRRPSAVQARAEAALLQGNLPAALAQLEEGLSLSPQSVELRLLRAQVLVRLNRRPEALGELEAVRETAPGHDEARALLVQTLASSPDSAETARQAAVAWRDEQPEALRPRIVLAALDIQAERFSEALREYEEAGRLFPRDVTAQLGAGMALCGLGRYGEARERWTGAITAFPEDVVVKQHLARLLVTCPDASVRDPERGLTFVQELLQVHDALELQETLACAFAASGQMDEARRVLSDLARRSGEPPPQSRLYRIGEALAAGRIWTERWPFAELVAEERAAAGSAESRP